MNSSPGSERRAYFQANIDAIKKAFPDIEIISREQAHEALGVHNRIDAYEAITRGKITISDVDWNSLTPIQQRAISDTKISIEWE